MKVICIIYVFRNEIKMCILDISITIDHNKVHLSLMGVSYGSNMLSYSFSMNGECAATVGGHGQSDRRSSEW